MTTTDTTPIAQQSTRDLTERLSELREQAGAAWGPGFVDAEAAALVEELQSRRTPAALTALRKLAADLGWREEE